MHLLTPTQITVISGAQGPSSHFEGLPRSTTILGISFALAGGCVGAIHSPIIGVVGMSAGLGLGYVVGTL